MVKEEIKLADYLSVIFRQKWLILGITIGAILVSLVISLTAAPKYKGSIVLEIGQITVFKDGESTNMMPESSVQTKEKINNKAYDNLLEKKKINLEKIDNVEASVIKDNNNIVIVTITAADKEEGKKYLDALGEIIISNQNDVFFNRMSNYFKNLIKQEKQKLAAIENNRADLPSLQYLYAEHLSRIVDAEASLNSMRKTEVVKSAENLSPQKSLLVNLIISLIVGLFLGIVFVFLREFWQENKKEILER